MRVLYIAEIVGKAGVFAVKTALAALKRERGIDFTIACADGATGGYGLGRNHAAYLRKLGADTLTTGECVFYKKDLVENMGRMPYVLRPANLTASAPGLGCRTYAFGGHKVAVAVLLGQAGFGRLHADNPYAALPVLLERLKRETPNVIVDFHASATAEKLSLFALADGHCSAILGSHARVQTADEHVSGGGTAMICDAGRTGSLDSVGGTDIASRIAEYRSGIPDWTRDAWEKPELQGVVIDIRDDGRASSIERVRIACPRSGGQEDEDGRDSASPQDRGDDDNG